MTDKRICVEAENVKNIQSAILFNVLGLAMKTRLVNGHYVIYNDTFIGPKHGYTFDKIKARSQKYKVQEPARQKWLRCKLPAYHLCIFGSHLIY